MKKNNFLFKRLALMLVGGSFAAFAWGQTEISSVEGLKSITNDLAGSYKLTADIELTEDWVPISEFTGTLDGNGHIISGLRVDESEIAERALFAQTKGATIKRLGIENAHVVGNQRVGGIVGLMQGGLLEECYVANSYVEGYDHVGTIIGQMKGGAKLTNCYSTSHIYSRGHQAGGLVGMINDNDTEISNCYFSGIVRCGTGSRPCGIVASRDYGSPIVKYCVNLAPYVLGDGNLRLTGALSEIKKTALYSLSTTRLGGRDDYAGAKPITNLGDGNYGTDKGHGANIPGGDQNAKNAAFYADGDGIDGFDGLGWDFEAVWKMSGGGYPILQWQSQPLKDTFLYERTALALLKAGESLDITSVLTATGYDAPLLLTLTTESDKLVVDGTKLSIKEDVTITTPEEIKVSVTSADLTKFNFEPAEVTVALLPDGVVSITSAEQMVYMNLYPEGSYQLAADIDYAGLTIDGYGSEAKPFKGTLDGNGHIIKNFRIDASGRERVGFINYTVGATIKRLGVEGAYVKGKKRAGVLVGEMHGGMLDQCYVADSYSESSDHVGALVGTAFDDALIQDCYANSRVKTSDNQAGGLVGVTNNTKISRCYFSGIVESPRTRANGLVALVDANNDNRMIVENSVVLAPVLINADTGSSEFKRVIDVSNKGAVLTNNYALSTMLMGKLGEQTTRTSDDASGSDGKDVDAATAKTADFYATTLGWNLSETWTLLPGAYPILAWQTAPVNTTIVNLEDAYSLRVGEEVDLSKLVSAHGLKLSFSTESQQLTVTDDGKVTTLGGVFPPENAIVNVSIDEEGFTLVNDEITVRLFPADVVEIDHVDKFLLIAQYPEMDYKLMTDIDLTGKEFNGIGSQEKPFTGSFDGNGHIVKNFTVAIGDDRTGAGLFCATNGAVITKLGVENASVKILGDKKSTGVIIGEMRGGLLEECYVSDSYVEGFDHAGGLVGTIYDKGVIRNSYSAARVYSRAHQAGGLTGSIQGGTTIENCYFSGLVTNAGGRSIGLGGYHDGGDLAVTIKNSVNMAPYIFSGNMGSMFRIFDNNNDRPIALTNNYSLNTTRLGRPSLTDLYSIGTEDVNYGADKRHGADATAEQLKTQDFYANTLTWDLQNVWTMPEGTYPVLKWQTEREDKIAGTVFVLKDTYTLNEGGALNLNEYVFHSHGAVVDFTTEDGQVGIDAGQMTIDGTVDPQSEVVVSMNVSASDYFAALTLEETMAVTLYPALIQLASAEDMLIPGENLSGNYVLANDIMLSGDWTPIANFTGTFDGAGHTISGLKVDASGSNNIGLFATTQNATIKNLCIKETNFTGNDAVGAIVGVMSGGSIDQCYLAADCNLNGRQDVGAFVGIAADGASITNSYAKATVRARDQEAGGIVGNLRGSTVDKCYFDGVVNSYRNAAGIVGRADTDGGKVSNTVNLSDEIWPNDSGRATYRIMNTSGKNVTLENNYSLSTTLVNHDKVVVSTDDAAYGADKMHGANITGGDDKAKTKEFYLSLGWDFADNSVWIIEEGVAYPQLKIFASTIGTGVEMPETGNGYSFVLQAGDLHIVNLPENAKVDIYDICGRLVLAQTVSNEMHCQLTEMGVYIVRIAHAGTSTAVKVVNR